MSDAVYPTEDDERVLRMTKLEVEIEKGRMEMRRLDQELRADGRRFLAQAGLTAAALITASVAATAYFLPRRVVAPPQQIIITLQVPPGTTASVSPQHK